MSHEYVSNRPVCHLFYSRGYLIPPSLGKSPFSLDCYLSWMSRISPVYASLWLLKETQARLGAGMKSLLLFRRALSSPTMCRFIPALSDG
jgi:hypothetical protein